MKKVIFAITTGAAFAVAAFADRELWIPALACAGWVVLVAFASFKKPRAATRSRKVLNFQNHHSTPGPYFQDKFVFWRD